MKKYLVTLECHTLHTEEVEANNIEEAKEIALNQGRGTCTGDGLEVYEVEIISN